MAIKLASLFFDIGARGDKLYAELTKSKRQTSSWSKDIEKIGSRATKVFGGFALGVGVANTALVAGYKINADYVDQLAKTSAKLGTTTESLTSMRFAADQAGLAQTALDVGLQRMVRRLSEAGKGLGEARGALKELGLDAKDLAAQTPEQALTNILRELEAVESQNDRVRLAFKFFDTEGVGFVNLTADALVQAAADAEALGGAISKIEAKAIEDANDSVSRLQFGFSLLTQRLTANLAPSIGAVADELFESAKNGEGLEKQLNDLIQSSLVGFGNLTVAAGEMFRFLDGRSEIVEYGLIGYMLFGKKGALIGGLLGSVTDTIEVNLNKITGFFDESRTETEQLLIDLQALETELKNIGENQSFLGDTVGGVINGIVYDSVEEIDSQIAEIENRLLQLAETNREAANAVADNSSFSEAAANAFETLGQTILKSADEYGKFADSVEETNARLGDGAGLIDPDRIAEQAREAFAERQTFYANDITAYSEYQVSRQEAATNAADILKEIALREFNDTKLEHSVELEAYQQYQDGRVEAARLASEQIDLTLTGYFAKWTTDSETFQNTWTQFEQAGAAGRAKILYAETKGALSTLASHSRKFFELNKAAAIGNAIVNIGEGVTAALKLPFPTNLLAAAKTALEGGAALLSIKNAKFGGGSVASPGSGGSVNAEPLSDVSGNSGTAIPDGTESGGTNKVAEFHIHLGGRSREEGQQEFLKYYDNALRTGAITHDVTPELIFHDEQPTL